MSGEHRGGGDSAAWRFITWTFGIGWGLAALLRTITGPMSVPVEYSARIETTPAAIILSVLFFLLPAIIAFTVARSTRTPLRRWGLRWPGLTPLLIAPLVALGLALLATALPVILGISEFEPSGMGEVQRLAEEQRIEALELKLQLEDEGAVLSRKIGVRLLGGLILGLLFAPIIELPWRGLLLTGLSGHRFAIASLTAGAVAAAWWLPHELLVGSAGVHGSGIWAVTLISYALLGIPLAWARIQTDSILPAGVLAVTVSAMSEIPALATAGGSHLQLELCGMAAVGLLAAAAIIWQPKTAQSSEGGRAEQ